jgi:hypothetical protein
MVERDIIYFQIHRQIIGLAKDSLTLLDATHGHIKELEGLLVKMGINEEVYGNSNWNYQKDRTRVLGKANDSIRELQSLISSFEIKLKKD